MKQPTVTPVRLAVALDEVGDNALLVWVNNVAQDILSEAWDEPDLGADLANMICNAEDDLSEPSHFWHFRQMFLEYSQHGKPGGHMERLTVSFISFHSSMPKQIQTERAVITKRHSAQLLAMSFGAHKRVKLRHAIQKLLATEKPLTGYRGIGAYLYNLIEDTLSSDQVVTFTSQCAMSWEHFSGDLKYPVSGRSVYLGALRSDTLWSGAQLRLRRSLLKHMIACLELADKQ